MINRTLHRRLKIEQYESHKLPVLIQEWWAVSSTSDTRRKYK